MNDRPQAMNGDDGFDETDDGGVIVYLDGRPVDGRGADEDEGSKHNENLAEVLDEGDLATMAGNVLLRIEEDDRSRSEWLQQRTRGIDLLGLKLEAPRADIGSSAAPMEGMSTVRHPLLFEASLTFQANARGELLPSSGPVKVTNQGAKTVENDEAAKQLEDGVNAFLTVTASEYYPDTDRMLFQVGWSGAGFKKGYHCPLRRRPVIEAIDAEDLIVSNTATDIRSAPRVTHRIKMEKSVLIRMQIAKAYRRVELTQPVDNMDAVERKIARVQGIDKTTTHPSDTPHTIYECYCDYDIPGMEHKIDGEVTGLPLPYKIVIDRDSRKILEIRRNWKEDDEDCKKINRFVLYPFVPMFGFYPSGLLQILGNTTNAVTAAWRMMLDLGMFSSFPGFLYNKNGVRQQTNSFRVAPGSGAAIDVGGSGSIKDAVMPLPYKELNPAFIQLIENIASTGQRVGGTAQSPVAEGKQDAPVGTTLALIEQQLKIIGAVHKRIHTAQSEEFQMLKELLAEDPESLWRHRKDAKQITYTKEMAAAALQNYDLVPVADPNTPSHMHRLMKLMALKQMAMQNPALYDAKSVDTHCLREMGFDDPERFFAPPQPVQGAMPDPNMMRVQVAQSANQIKMQSDQVNAAIKAKELELKQADLASRERQKQLDAATKIELQKLQIAEHLAVHPLSQQIIANEVLP